MQEILVEALVNKGVIKKETVLTITLIRRGFGGSSFVTNEERCIVETISKNKITQNLIFSVLNKDTEEQFKINSDIILRIDGMDPANLATVYNIKADGTDQPLGKKRGRKPKVRS